MRVIRTVDDLQNAVLDALCPVVDRDLATRVARFIIYDEGEPTVIEEVVKRVGNHKFDKAKVEDFSETVFQLRDYKDVLKVYMNILIKCRQFENIFAFVNRLIVSHIGNESYVSKAKSYRIEERYFDRFIEIINYCGIKPDDCYEFFMAIATAGDNNVLSAWKEPLKEYSQLLKNRASDGIIYTSIEDKVVPSAFNETPSVVEEHVEVFEKPIKIYTDVQGVEEQVDEPKPVKEPRVVPIKRFANATEFETEVRDTVEVMQERMYGIRLKKYYADAGIPLKSLDGLIMTYVIDQFKTMEEVGFDNVLNSVEYVDESLGHKIAYIVYEVATLREKLLKSKWAMRLISLLADTDVLNKCFELISHNFTKNKAACTYFIDCIVRSGRREFTVLYRLLNRQKLTNKQKNYLTAAMYDLSELIDIDVELLYDEACDDFELNEKGARVFDFGRRVLEIRVTGNGEIEYYNIKTNKPARISDKVVVDDYKLKDYLTALKKGVSYQTKRLIGKYRNFQTYSVEDFENILLNNHLLRKLAEGIVWGRYNNGKLLDIFLIRDGKVVNVEGSSPAGDYVIGIAHSTELGRRAQDIANTSLLFDQLTPAEDVRKYSGSETRIVNLLEQPVDEKVFVNKLKHREYCVNDLDNRYRYSQLVRVRDKLNIVTVVDISIVSQGEEQFNKTNASVSFYRLSKLDKDVNGNFNISNASAMRLEELPQRVLSDEIGDIFESAR